MSDKIVAIQALRLVAALAVVATHLHSHTIWLGEWLGVEVRERNWIRYGEGGVDLFFVISGFIMVYSSGKLYGQRNARKTFVIRRLIRIVPLYWLATATFFLLLVVLDEPLPGIGKTVSSLVFYPWAAVPNGDDIQPIIGVGWTLYFEMFFYLLLALCLSATAARTVARAIPVLVVAMLVGTTMALPNPFRALAQPILAEFVLGMLIALLVQRGFAPGPWIRGAAVAVALTIFALFAANAEAGGIGWYRVLGYGVPSAFIVLAATTGETALGKPGWWAFGGDISYAVYLFHQTFLEVWRLTWDYLGLPLGTGGQIGFFVLGMVGVVVGASVIFLGFDKPVTKILNRLATPRRAERELSVSGV